MIEQTKTDWQRLNRKVDKDVDYSDISKTDNKFWADSDVIIFHNKVDYTLKLDEDLAKWLNEIGNESNQALNNIIRAYYMMHL